MTLRWLVSFSLAALTPHDLLPDLSRHSMSPLPPSSVRLPCPNCSIFSLQLAELILQPVFLQLPCDLLYLSLPADPDDTTTPHHMIPVFFTIAHMFDLFAQGKIFYARCVKETCLLVLRSAPCLRLFLEWSSPLLLSTRAGFAVVNYFSHGADSWPRVVRRKKVHHHPHLAAHSAYQYAHCSTEPLLSGGSSHFCRL